MNNSVKYARRGTEGVLKLTGEQTISSADTLHAAAAKAVADDGATSLTIDAVKAERIDTAAWQVILAFVKTAKEAGRPISFKPAEGDYVASAAALGISLL